MRDASHASDRPAELLERGVAFDVLCESLESVRRSRKGRVVLVGGEAGVRKTALLRWFCRDEDVHWADEATLDVLKLLARRVATVPVLVVASFRDEGLDSGHPLRRVLGELATSATVRRLKLDPLSPSAVAELAELRAVDPDELYRKTAGNPFFVVEALAAGVDEIPDTVRDAVLARVARLSAPARLLVEAVA